MTESDPAVVDRWLDACGRRELTLLLFAAWDPIGVSDDVDLWREYESYVDDVVGIVRSGGGAPMLAEHLERVAATDMHVATGADVELATTVLTWMKASISAWQPQA